jgi:hypothetical protein
MKLKYRIQKTVALILLILTLALAITSCKGRPLSQTELASTEVGRVGEYSVLYEELYFLANNYKTGLEDDYKNDAEGLKKAVWDSVKSNITENYAILELCKSEGLIYDEKALRKEVDNAIELDIEASFDGSRKDFFESQRAVGLTDHYVRFITGVNLLYSEYAAKLKESDSFPRTDTELVNYISENFVHTWHIAVFVNDGGDRDEKLAKLREAQDLLNNGTSMYELIGSKYNEDATPEENRAAMEERIAATKTTSVTYAAHDSTFDGKKIQSGQMLGLVENKVKYVTDTREECLRNVADAVKKSSIITVYYGEDVTAEEAEKAVEILTECVNPYAEITLIDGGQPVYAYIISGEDE